MKLNISISIPDAWLTSDRALEYLRPDSLLRFGVGPADAFGRERTLALSATVAAAVVLEGGTETMVIVNATAIPDSGEWSRLLAKLAKKYGLV